MEEGLFQTLQSNSIEPKNGSGFIKNDGGAMHLCNLQFESKYSVDFKNLYKLVVKEEYNKAEKLLKSLIESEQLSNSAFIEKVFSLKIYIGSNLRHFIKNLKIDKVPPLPLDTNYDLGRRFFYYLYILNRSCGYKIVSPYLNGIKLNRPGEKRLLADIYFFNNDYSKARDIYIEAAQEVGENFDEFIHLPIFTNSGACSLYLEDYEKLHSLKVLALEKTKNHPKVLTSYAKYEVLALAQQRKPEEALRLFNEFKRTKVLGAELTNADKNFSDFINIALTKRDPEEFKILFQTKLLNVWQGNLKSSLKTPEQVIGLCHYFKELSIFGDKDFLDLYPFENTIYPINEFKILNKTFEESKFRSFGNPQSSNFINLKTGEFNIYGKKGIGLTTETKAIYWLIRCHEFGVNYETLASYIYEQEDISGIFLVKDRIKQILHRIKNEYKIPIETKNFRAYISPADVKNFYLTNSDPLRINRPFTVDSFMDFYGVSKSKAQKKIRQLDSLI